MRISTAYNEGFIAMIKPTGTISFLMMYKIEYLHIKQGFSFWHICYNKQSQFYGLWI
jgi:hypothetical protein